MTLTLPEEAFLDHVDWHIECASDGCGQPADWWQKCRSCRSHVPLCDGCHDSRIAWAEKVSDEWDVICSQCGAFVVAHYWRTLFSFVPVAL